MSKDKDQKASVPKVTHIKIGDSKKKKTKSFIDFAAEYTKKSKEKSSFEELESIVQESPVKAEDFERKLEEPNLVDITLEETTFEVPTPTKSTEVEIPKTEVKSARSDISSAIEEEAKEETGFFPRFLRKQEKSATPTKKSEDSLDLPDENLDLSEKTKELKFLTTSDEKSKGTLHGEPVNNLNSFSSIFNRDSSSIAGVRRVFKKSATMMVISFILFSFLSFLSLHLFSINLLWVILLQILFITVTNIFYIIVADRSYVWIGIGLQALVFLTAHSFIGEGFTIPTFFVLLLVVALTYFGYSDVEKTQLSSRLFSINHVTSDSVRMLGSVVSLVLAIGMFNSALSAGSEGLLRDEVFENKFVTEQIIVGDALPGLNWLLLKEADTFANADQIVQRTGLGEENADSNLNLYTFIYYNYGIRSGESIFTDNDQKELSLDSSIDIVAEREKITRERAEDFRQEVYKRLPYTLDTILTKDKFNRVVEETYVYMATKFESGSNASLSQLVDIPLIPRNYILPGALAILVFGLSFFFNFILRIAINFITNIIWFVLKKFDFARIDVEKVEAEVVTI